jgi:Kef-type K+ transport system membrane component KefB
MFFLLAGYQCELQALTVLGGLGAAYIAARSIGLIVGGSVAASQAGATPVVAQRIGWCLLPQAGVALGLVLLVVERFPALGARILPLVLATTVVFELVGPPVTRWHLRRAGEL